MAGSQTREYRPRMTVLDLSLFTHLWRLTIVVFCDSLGTCAFECPTLPMTSFMAQKVDGLANAVFTV